MDTSRLAKRAQAAMVMKASSGYPAKRAFVASDDAPVIPPPNSVQVEAVPRVVLYAHDGTPLQRKMGF